MEPLRPLRAPKPRRLSDVPSTHALSPRDIIVLLNHAFQVAARGGRREIIENDVQATARHISQDRLSDLKHEYDSVFPGLPLFISAFSGGRARYEYGEAVELLDDMLLAQDFGDGRASDFGILGSGQAIFHALYSVGFLGVKDPQGATITFCHDGARSDLSELAATDEVLVHPCYWKALEIEDRSLPADVVLDIHDEYAVRTSSEARDFRIKMLGRLVSELPSTSTPTEFEEWVLRAVQIVFAGKLKNPGLHPNKDSVQRRDVVATNMAQDGFWNRILNDYGARQVVFEVKDYESLKLEDYRQSLSYSGKEYGRFGIIVSRQTNEGVAKAERGWIQEMYNQHDRLIFHLPAILLARFMKKLRNPERKDYAERVLNKRLDTYLRSYVQVRH